MTYSSDRKYSDQFIERIYETIGPLLFRETSEIVDQEEASDLTMIKAQPFNIACRIRRPRFFSYRDQFTVRLRRDSGTTTELAKIVDGHSDLMFYGIAANDETDELAAWAFIDLVVFREQVKSNEHLEFGDKSNGDGTFFRWYRLRSFQSWPPILIAASISVLNAIGTPAGQCKTETSRMESPRNGGTVTGRGIFGRGTAEVVWPAASKLG